MQLAQLALNDYLEPATSYLSVIELGLYESTIKTYQDLKDRGIAAHSEEWKREINDFWRGRRKRCALDCFRNSPSIVTLLLSDGPAAR